jgi:hypothetical protein
MAKHKVTMTTEGLKNFFLERIDGITETVIETGVLADTERNEIAENMRDFTLSLIEANSEKDSEKQEQIPATHDQVSILMNVVVWLYTKDKTFKSVEEWRSAFIAYLSKLLNVELKEDEKQRYWD